MQEERKGMSTTAKVLIGCGSLTVLAVIGLMIAGWYMVSDMMVTDPKEITAMAKEISAGAELPQGYTGQVGMNLSGIKMAVLQRDHKESITLASGPHEAADKIREQMGKETDKAGSRTWLDPVTLTVGNAEVEFQQSRLQTDGGTALVFEGSLARANETLLMIFHGPESSFDHDGMKAFLATLK